ncbi:ExbD/TolR family protein [Nannocystaceae bacterium ST9]
MSAIPEEPSGGSELNAEINVTPMIDILMSLLIIFMVASAPATMHNQPINVPKDPVTQVADDPNATLLIKIDAAGSVTIGKTPVANDRAALVEALKNNEKAQNESRVAIKPDDKVPYGKVIDVFAAAREAGIGQIGIASDRL